MELQTEIPFTLPVGYVDSSGVIHKEGVMALATAKDEITPLMDLRVQRNRAYLIIVLLTRVLKKLGTVKDIHTGIIENLFAADLRYLEELYNRINEDEATLTVRCPECGTAFQQEFVGIERVPREEARKMQEEGG